MTRRYFHPFLPESGGIVELSADEAAHANRVMRVKPGDSIELFDGKGCQAIATVVKTTRNGCCCDAQSAVGVSREPERFVTGATALPKGDRAKAMVERLTELGVKRLVPLLTDRTQGNRQLTSWCTKLERVTVEACKQCGRNELMEIAGPIESDAFIANCDSRLRLIADPAGEPVRIGSDPAALDVSVLIGPEGGFSREEYTLAVDHGFAPFSLGPRIYRIETAAIAMATLLIHS